MQSKQMQCCIFAPVALWIQLLRDKPFFFYEERMTNHTRTEVRGRSPGSFGVCLWSKGKAGGRYNWAKGVSHWKRDFYSAWAEVELKLARAATHTLALHRCHCLSRRTSQTGAALEIILMIYALK